MIRDKEIRDILNGMAWLMDDTPRVKRFLEISGKEIINDFKEKDEPKPKKENTSPTNPFKGCIIEDA